MKLRINESYTNSDKLLTEDQWYRVDINPGININNTTYNDVYIWARNDKGTLGTTQVQNIYNDALYGKYRGRGKEQSFNRDVADEISSKRPAIVNITSITGKPPSFDNALSRTDRGLRIDAHDSQEANIRAIVGNSNDNVLIHHLNKNEGDQTLSNLVAIFDTYGLNKQDSKMLLDIGHFACHLSQQLHGGIIGTMTYTIPAYDFSTTPPTVHNITITI